MNKNLKYVLKNRSSEKGFAIPIAVGLGLVMILISSTMIVRSQGDRVTASAQKSTAKSLNIAETGITRVQAFLNKNRGLSTQPHRWTSYLENLAISCRAGSLYAEAETFNDWITIGGDDRFKVISYTPSATEGVLVVEGQVRQGSNVTSTTRLQAKIGLDRTRIPSFAPPGAWAQNFGLGNNRITGSVIDAGCPPGSLTTSERSQISGNVMTDPSLTLPPALPVPNVCTGTQVYPLGCGAMSLSAIDGNLRLPRTSPTADVANANGEYIYYVAQNGSGKSIDLGGNNRLIIKPGTKVKLYLQGNIDTSGGGVKIGHNCNDTDVIPDGEANPGATQVAGCEPTNFQIYGGTGTTSVVLGGGNTIDAFIFAPNAVRSGVNGGAEIRGSIWLKEWDRANGNHNVISQTGSWNNIPTLLWPPRIAPLSSWQRIEAS